jgi:hypothetical protein
MHRRWTLRGLALVALAAGATACGGSPAGGDRTTPLRPACGDGERWDGGACQPRGGDDDLAAAVKAIDDVRIDDARAALDRAAERPLAHDRYLRLWEQRGMAAAAAEDPDAAQAAFARLLAADPAYAIDCELGGPIFRPFQSARAAAAGRAAPELELRWRRDLRLGAPVPIEVETIADPAAMMRDLTVYVRARGEEAWRAADLALPAPGAVTRLVLPPVSGRAPTTLELFAIASDPRGNEVHRWASREHPRELPLRYDPPTPWYRKWWVWAAAGGVVAVGTGIGVYAAVWEPSDSLDAPIGAR